MLGFFVLQPFKIEADWDVGLEIGCGHESSGFEDVILVSCSTEESIHFIHFTSQTHSVPQKKQKKFGHDSSSQKGKPT